MDGYIPYEPNNFDAHEYNSIYPLIRFNSATSAAPTLYHQGIISLAGRPRIGVGDCAFCINAPYTCVLISSTQGASSCWHFLCSACAIELLQSDAPVCRVCRRRICISIWANFS